MAKTRGDLRREERRQWEAERRMQSQAQRREWEAIDREKARRLALRYVVIDAGRKCLGADGIKRHGGFYHGWDKAAYSSPRFGDYVGAKQMTAQGCASALRMLRAAGYTVERQKV